MVRVFHECWECFGVVCISGFIFFVFVLGIMFELSTSSPNSSISRPRSFSTSCSLIEDSVCTGSGSSTLVYLSSAELQVLETGSLPSTRKRRLGEN